MTRSFASTFPSILLLLASAACGPAPYDHQEPTGPSSAVEVATERQALASWSSAAPMSTARLDHSATVLPSGKVLVAGGDTGTSTYLASAALYDPATNTWSATGSMTQARSAHVAVLLSSGKVLVIGGTFGSTTAELYDPATGTWTATGSLATLRTNFTATLLSSGQVLVTGGRGNGGVYLTSCELYDPATGTWSATGSLAVGRMDHSAVQLGNGQVLVSGGLYMVFTSVYRLNSAELYDPATGTWSTTGSLATERSGHLSLLLPSGNALIVGGLAGSGRLLTGFYSVSAAESFSAGTLSSAGTMSSPRHGHAAAALPSGAVLVAGGLNKIGGSSTTQYLSSASLYDPATGTWSATASMLAVRNHFTLSALPSGKVLAVGGTNSSGMGLASTELYTP